MERKNGLLRRAVRTWREAARAIGVVQTQGVMLLVYLVAVLPVGVVLRISGKDPLRLRSPEGSNWTPCEESVSDIAEARRQF